MKDDYAVTRKDLQKLMGGLSGPSITSLRNALSKKDYIIRDTDERDGRYMRLSIADKGYSVLAELNGYADNFEKALTMELTGVEQRKLVELLEKVYASLEQLYPIE